MALVNPNIAMSFRGVEMPQQNALADYAAIQQIQGGQRQAEVSQMQLDKMRREESGLDQMMATITAKGGPSDPMVAADAMIKSRIPQYVEMGFKLQAAARQRTEDMAAMGLSPTAAPAAAAAAPVSEPYPGYNESIGMPAPVNALAPAVAAPAPVNAMAPAAAAPSVNAMAPSADREAQIRSAKLKMLSPTAGVRDAGKMELEKLLAPPPFRSVAAGASVLGPDNKVIFTAPAAAAAPPSMVAEYNFAKTADGGGFKGTYQQFVTARAAAGRAPAAPRPEQPPVAVVDPVTGKPVYVTREQALSGKMTPASAMEGLPPKEIQAREAKYPAATSAVKAFETSAERLAADLEKLAVHPGLSGISGLIYGRTPAVTKDARAAQALYDGIVARGGFQELQNMRASSPTGGALGNVSNQEGQYLRDAFAPINRTQDTADLSRALTEAAGATRSSKQRLRDAYDMTYDYKNQGKASAPAAAAGAPDIDALLNKYK